MTMKYKTITSYVTTKKNLIGISKLLEIVPNEKNKIILDEIIANCENSCMIHFRFGDDLDKNIIKKNLNNIYK
jgi:hypothetical protein